MPQWYVIDYPGWSLQGPSFNYRGRRGIDEPSVCLPPYISLVMTHDGEYWERWGCGPQNNFQRTIIYILLLITSALSASILLAATHIFSLMVTMTQKMKEESENPEKHHDEMMTLRKMYCRIFRILISFTRMRILPVILTRPNMNMLNELTGSRKDFSKFLIG